jgi:hypothetical protein
MSAAITHDWDTAPAAGELPLRETLPRISQPTRLLLHSWAWQQPGVRGWLLQRQHDYHEAQREEWLVRNPSPESAEELHHLVDAVCALDLLRWQCGCLDREALEKLSGCAEVAALEVDRGMKV